MAIKKFWESMPETARRIILIEIVVLAALMLALCALSAARADTYTCVVHKGEWVWIRSGPSYEAPQIGQIRYGYEVDVTEFVDGFAHIRWTHHDGNVTGGYVAAQYLEISIPETMYRVITEGGPLAKRETPNGRLMCWIKRGTKISVLGWRYAADGSMWAKVYKGGYVHSAFLGEM